MNVVTVVLALLSACANAAASVLQRRAAVEWADRVPEPEGSRVRRTIGRWAGLPRRPFWIAGAAALVLSAAFQAGALAVGRLSVVQPLLASELLFTLVVGSMVFHHRPDGRTWLSFLALAAGLALFLLAVSPSGGEETGEATGWLPVGAVLAVTVLGLLPAARTLDGAARAAVLGCATAVCFACTAALIKEVTGRIGDGFAAVFANGYPYAAAAVGLLSFMLLQSTLGAGTLAASQPALTLGDALVSVGLGWTLFGERIPLGLNLLTGALGAFLVATGTAFLAQSLPVSGSFDAEVGTTRRRARGGPAGTGGTGRA
ncbi:DMT family transporter [Streptomyces sp. B1I3]|uniref:DMT family transporter n=1 Tax=Streptomyces sp. B1I3 TaxID=3042264 RepID=UPI0027823B03|nr:DMT family transporter [Streptomyces sp. B1I3]MDQ0792124.1 drug/metabolite transporter (DMT)-like permease [Streptomyces sp. B1I3]